MCMETTDTVSRRRALLDAAMMVLAVLSLGLVFMSKSVFQSAF